MSENVTTAGKLISINDIQEYLGFSMPLVPILARKTKYRNCIYGGISSILQVELEGKSDDGPQQQTAVRVSSQLECVVAPAVLSVLAAQIHNR